MKRFFFVPVLVLVWALPVHAQGYYQPYPPPGPWGGGVPSLDGVWYLSGDPNKVCEIHQRPGDPRALFINENGSQADGSIRGNRIWIPEWNNGRGQAGVVQGDRIVFPDGNFWSREPLSSPYGDDWGPRYRRYR